MKTAKFILLLLIYIFEARAKISGCTDIKAINYNPVATLNDGSCMYPGANIAPQTSLNLSSDLVETSGLIHWNNALLSHNDDTNNKLYAVDTATGVVAQSYTLTGTVNKDWEEIAQDDNYIYVGDFGNNSSGNRKDLHILRVSKNTLLLNNPAIDTIFFSYDNQTNFTATAANSTDFDCEAFLVTSDSIYLFTKQWISEKTSIYAIPKIPGTYTAALRSTINIQGLATGITYLESQRLAVLVGYSKLLQPFFYLLYDFRNNDFANGNKRKITINLLFHQIEGIATANGLKYYVTNENLTSPFSIPQKLHTFDLSGVLGPYLNSVITGITHIKKQSNLSIFPNPTGNFVQIEVPIELIGLNCSIYDVSGKIIKSVILATRLNIIDTQAFPSGIYFLQIDGQEQDASFIKQ